MNSNKIKNLEKLSNNGIISALAIDQRGSLQKMLGLDNTSDDSKIIEFKKLVSAELTPYASSILLDPEYGLQAAKVRDESAGLLLAYEKTGYDTAEPGRMPDLLENWSVKRIKENGANAVKFMLYYDVDEDKKINDKKQAFVERVGSECLAEEIPFFLELMSYDTLITDTKSREYAKIKPHKVNQMIKEFAKSRYNVDVLKVEVPVNMEFVEGFGEGQYLYTKEEAQKLFKQQDEYTNGVPYIFLSAGVSAKLFQDTLRFAHESKATFNGVLCGRATWRNGVQPFAKNGPKEGQKWLDTEGKKNIKELNEILVRTATPWYNKVKNS